MIVDNIISDIIAKTTLEMSGVDQPLLKRIIADVMCKYEIHATEISPEPSDMADKIEEYLSSRKLDGASPLTIKNYRYRLVKFSDYMNKSVSRITTVDIRAYLSYVVTSSRIKQSTLETQKSIIKSFFAWLEDEEYIAKSPAKKIRAVKVDRRVRTGLSLEEFELIRCACLTDRQRCMIELFFSTGIRLSELSRIDLADINWGDRSIKVLGKGNKERIVYFSEKTIVYLRKYIDSRGDYPSPALFITSKKPHNRMGPKSIENEIKTIAIASKVESNVFPHRLRHTFASQAVRSGMSLYSLHSILGHSKIDTTLVYVDADPESVAYEHGRRINQ